MRKQINIWIVRALIIFNIMNANLIFADGLNPGDVFDESKIGVAARFIPIKAAEFVMGSPESEPGRSSQERQHTVRLTHDYEIQATEVTQLQYFLVMGHNPSAFTKEDDCDENNYQVLSGVSLCTHHPVESIQWDETQKFIAAVNKLSTHYMYRLPTEAEWEYAARAGSFGFPFSFGFNDGNRISKYAWYQGNSANTTHAVAQRKPNPYGLYDVHGNVQEWVQDLWDYYPWEAVTIDPTGATSEYWGHVLRGGCFDAGPDYLRTAYRGLNWSDQRFSDVGFRLVRAPK